MHRTRILSAAHTLLIAALALALATGCADNSDERSRADSSDVADRPIPEPSTEEESAEVNLDKADGSRFESVYTDLDLDECEMLGSDEIGGHVELRCPGYRGIDLFVTEGDLRFDVDVGVPNDIWTSQLPFNYLGETVEWRLRDGVPFAVIIRYHLDDGTYDFDGGTSKLPPLLAVITVGREGSPGCIVGWVPVDARPSQNEAARRLADEEGEGFDCGDSG